VDARWPLPDCASPHGLAADIAGRRLFASCVNQKLMVLNMDTGAVVAVLPIGRGSDAAAYDPVRHLVFSSNGVDGDVTVIEQSGPDAYTPLPPLKTSVSGRTMAVDPATGRLFVVAADTTPSPTPGGRPRPVPGSVRLMVFAPAP
jgi:DNA-binding beta-propeller fold protein YncE